MGKFVIKKYPVNALIMMIVCASIAAILDTSIANAQNSSLAQTKNMTSNIVNNSNTTRTIKPLFDGQKIKAFYMTLGSQAQWQLIDNYLLNGYKIDVIIPFRQYYLVILERT